MTFGGKLQKLRNGQGWTQEQLAERLGVSRQALSKWELGAAAPDTENVLRISRLFDVSTDYLLHDEYESDGDIPAVRAVREATEKDRADRTLTIAGWALSALSALGLVVLGILGTAVFPVTYQVFEGSFTREYTGLRAFLMVHDLTWLFVLLCLTLASGAAILLRRLLFDRKKAGRGRK